MAEPHDRCTLDGCTLGREHVGEHVGPRCPKCGKPSALGAEAGWWCWTSDCRQVGSIPVPAEPPRAASLPLAPSDEEPERYHYPRGWGCAGQSSPSSEVATNDRRGFQHTPKESPMKHRTDILTPALALVSDAAPRTVRSDLEARVLVALLCAEGFTRVPAPLVARRMSRGRSVVYTWSQAEGTSPRLADVLAPPAFARIVLAGALAAVQQPRCGAPSRWEIARVLASVLTVIAACPTDEPERLTDDEIERQVAALDTAAAVALSKVEQLRQEQARRRDRKGAR